MRHFLTNTEAFSENGYVSVHYYYTVNFLTKELLGTVKTLTFIKSLLYISVFIYVPLHLKVLAYILQNQLQESTVGLHVNDLRV